ncbi:hypothetical protein P8452_30353 [Trifolium repens]|nr:hypothetical protein P8452_30353 [Trifolium repens]
MYFFRIKQYSTLIKNGVRKVIRLHSYNTSSKPNRILVEESNHKTRSIRICKEVPWWLLLSTLLLITLTNKPPPPPIRCTRAT